MSVFYIIKTAYKNLPWSFINTPETILNNCIKMKEKQRAIGQLLVYQSTFQVVLVLYAINMHLAFQGNEYHIQLVVHYKMSNGLDHQVHINSFVP
jgi:hypothetical protein